MACGQQTQPPEDEIQGHPEEDQQLLTAEDGGRGVRSRDQGGKGRNLQVQLLSREATCSLSGGFSFPGGPQVVLDDSLTERRGLRKFKSGWKGPKTDREDAFAS